jgi:sporulation protein YlmC with PRC-barrel domain
MNTPSLRMTPVTLAIASLTFAGAMSAATPARAQVAGESTRTDTTITESTHTAMGWSVKKTLMGKIIYNESGQKVGKVEDLIIAPDRNVSYVIVGAGGFIGIGRHDVAIPVTQIQDLAGKLVMAGATKDSVKAMPVFTYATDASQRDQFVAAADKDITAGKDRVAELDRQAGAATTDMKAGIIRRMTMLQTDVKTAETRLDEMKQADAARWKSFEASVNMAISRLRKSIDTAAG